jgi:ABC transporter DrrB family efflux protein
MTTLTTALPEQPRTTPRPEHEPVRPARITPLDTLRHVRTLAWRTLVQVKHNPMELLDFSVQPLMFLLLFTYVFGGAISGSTSDYLTFALPGIIVQNTLFTTLNTGTGLNTDLTKGVFDRLRSLPIARSAPLAGRIVADLAKQLWAIGMLLGLGYILGFRVHTGPLEALAAVGLVMLFALCVSWISVLVGMLVSEPEKVMVFGFTLIFPLTFISNAFVQTSTMPGWLQAFVKVNPVTALADATRGLLSSGPVATPTWHALLWAAGIAAVFAPLAVTAFKRRV